MAYGWVIIVVFGLIVVGIIGNNLIDSWRAVNLARYSQASPDSPVREDWSDDTQVIHTLDTE